MAISPVYYKQINEMIEFSMYLLEQKTALTAAINKTKSNLPIDLDGETSINQLRQTLSDTFRRMAQIKGKEITETNGGIGYRFNNEGNQVSYKCNVERVTTINFDRNKARSYAAKLSEKSDQASAEIDKCIINYDVDFTPEFDVNDCFDEVFEKFISR